MSLVFDSMADAIALCFVLLSAAYGGHGGCVRHLLGAGADVHAAMPANGAGAAHAAAQNGHVEVLKELVAAGADLARRTFAERSRILNTLHVTAT